LRIVVREKCERGGNEMGVRGKERRGMKTLRRQVKSRNVFG